MTTSRPSTTSSNRDQSKTVRGSYPNWSALKPRGEEPEPVSPDEAGAAQSANSAAPVTNDQARQPASGAAPSQSAATAQAPVTPKAEGPLAGLFRRLRRGTPPSRRPLPVLFRVWQAQLLFIVFGVAIFCYALYTQDRNTLLESAMATLLILTGCLPAMLLIALLQRYSALLAIGCCMIGGGLLAFYGSYAHAISPDAMAKLLFASAIVLGAFSLLVLMLSRFRFRFSVGLARQLTCLFCLPLSASLYFLWQRDKDVLQPFLEQNRWTWTQLAAQPAEVYSAWFSSSPQALFLSIAAAMILQFLFYTYLSLSRQRLNAYFGN